MVHGHEESRSEPEALVEVAQRLLAERGVDANFRDLLQRTEREVAAIADSMNVCRQRRAAAVLAKLMIANGSAKRMIDLMIEYDEAVRRERA